MTIHPKNEETYPPEINVCPVNGDNWRDIANLKVTESQQKFVAEPCYYLSLCCYGGLWNPLAVCIGEQVVGFMMWAIDTTDNSCWLGGILMDQEHQRKGYGRQAVQKAIAMLAAEHGLKDFALSYQPANATARHLYSTLGFIETDEWEDDEIVARLSF